jgi:hypothetical protein
VSGLVTSEWEKREESDTGLNAQADLSAIEFAVEGGQEWLVETGGVLYEELDAHLGHRVSEDLAHDGLRRVGEVVGHAGEVHHIGRPHHLKVEAHADHQLHVLLRFNRSVPSHDATQHTVRAGQTTA